MDPQRLSNISVGNVEGGTWDSKWLLNNNIAERVARPRRHMRSSEDSLGVSAVETKPTIRDSRQALQKNTEAMWSEKSVKSWDEETQTCPGASSRPALSPSDVVAVEVNVLVDMHASMVDQHSTLKWSKCLKRFNIHSKHPKSSDSFINADNCLFPPRDSFLAQIRHGKQQYDSLVPANVWRVILIIADIL